MIRYRLAAILAVLILSLNCLATVGVPRARADAGEEEESLSVTVSELTPRTVTGTDGTISVSGAVINRSDKPVTGVHARLDLAIPAFTLRDSITAWASGDSSRPPVLWQAGTIDVGDLAAGAKTTYTITVNAADLPTRLRALFGAHGLRVSASGVSDGVRLDATAQTFLLVDTAGAYKPTPLLLVGNVTAPGHSYTQLTQTSGPGKALVSSDFLSESGARKPVDGVSQVASAIEGAREGMALVVDPALLSSTSPLLTSSFAPRRQKTFPADPAMIKAVTQADASGADVSIGLWGAPDVAALEAAGATSVLDDTEWLTRAARLGLSEADPDLKTTLLPTGSGVSTNPLFSGASGIVIPDTAVRYQQQTYVPNALVRSDETNQQPALVADTLLSAALNSSDPSPAGRLASSQLAAALLAQHTDEQPYDPRLVVATLDASVFQRASAFTDATGVLDLPWVQPTRLDDALAVTPEDADITDTSPDETWETVADAYATSDSTLSHLRDMSDNGDLMALPIQQLRAFLASQALTGEERTRLAAALVREVGIVDGAVRAHASPTVNVISRSSNVPIQVSNDLPYPVTVTVTITPATPTVTMKSATTRVGARSSTTVQVPTQVISNGHVRTALHLRLPDGRDLTPTQTLNLRIHMGLEDRFLIVVAVLVVGALAWGIVRSLRSGRRMPAANT